MWGALILLLFFLVIDPTTRDAIVGALDEARVRLAVEAPLPYLMLVIVSLCASVSALIMRLWPRVEDKPRRVQILRRYQGPSEADLARARQAPAFGQHRFLELAWLIVPVRARIAGAKLLRSISGQTGLNA